MSPRPLLCALLAALAAPALAELPPDRLGRLLYTPAEREALRAARLRGDTAEPADAQPLQAATPTRLRLDGVVHRADRPSLAWLNGAAVEDGERWGDWRVLTRRGGAELVDSSGRRLPLSVGQTVELPSLRILDPIPRGGLASPEP